MIALRDYQTRLIHAARAEMLRGKRRVLCVMPTGAGKTVTAAAMVESAVAKGRRVGWLTHRAELVEQAATTLERFGLTVGVVSAKSRRLPALLASVKVCSIQTLLARESDRPELDVLFWDEAHHANDSAKEWTGLLASYPGAPIVGLTATPECGSGAGLGGSFDALVVGPTVRELTALWEQDHTQGLVPCRWVGPDRMLEAGQIAQDPVVGYREYGRGEHGEWRQAILFAKSVEEAHKYAASFNAAGVRAECVTGVTGNADREASLNLFRRGVVRVLTNVYVLTEGTDLPMAEVIMLARGAGSASIYLQMVGRGLRPSPGKTSCLLWDGRGVAHLHGQPDDERAYSLDGRGITLVREAACAVCRQPLGDGYPCSRCGYKPESATGEGTGETEVVGVPMSPARRWGTTADEQQRTRTLLKWVREATEKGHRPTAVRHKWRGVFGDELSVARLQWAIEEVRRAG